MSAKYELTERARLRREIQDVDWDRLPGHEPDHEWADGFLKAKRAILALLSPVSEEPGGRERDVVEGTLSRPVGHDELEGKSND